MRPGRRCNRQEVLTPFRDRTDAGRRLAELLKAYRGRHPVILALPRGGVPVAAEVARALSAPLGLLIVRKIGVPGQPELAMGAVVDGAKPIVVRNDQVLHMAGISDTVFDDERDRELKEIDRRRRRYLGGRPAPELAGRTVIVVDDGIATGATMRAALRAVRLRHPAWLVMAVPVGATDAVAQMRENADDVVCAEERKASGAIGNYYADFEQLSDDDVIALLAASEAPSTRASPNAQ